MGFERAHGIQCIGLAWPERRCLFFFVLVGVFISMISQWEFPTNKGNRESVPSWLLTKLVSSVGIGLRIIMPRLRGMNNHQLSLAYSTRDQRWKHPHPLAVVNFSPICFPTFLLVFPLPPRSFFFASHFLFYILNSTNLELLHLSI